MRGGMRNVGSPTFLILFTNTMSTRCCVRSSAPQRAGIHASPAAIQVQSPRSKNILSTHGGDAVPCLDIVVAQCSPDGGAEDREPICLPHEEQKNDGLHTPPERPARTRGVRLLLLKFYDNSALIYMYRPRGRERICRTRWQPRILAERGYLRAGRRNASGI